MPQNIIESIESKTIKINRKLKREFKDEKELDEKLKSALKPDKNGNVSVDDVKDFFLSVIEKDMIERKITKKEFEGFMSSFAYNAYGATNIDDVAKTVFTRDDLIQNKLAERKWANPPPEEVNKNIITDDIKDEDMHCHKIKNLLSEIEDKVFVGKVKQYQVFKLFDKDGDGYVSYDDFEKCLNSLKIQASREDVAVVMKLLDKEGKGYLPFNDFSRVVTQHMSTDLVNIKLND